MIPLVVSIDTEEDNWGPTRDGVSAENVRELPRLAEVLARLGLRATYFTSYQVAHRAWAAEILREVSAGSRAEIATHVHPWNTPPFDGAELSHKTMLCSYPLDQQLAKIRAATDAITHATGQRPHSFRAGRYGMGRETITALIQAGYRVDSSVTPYVSWEDYDHGPDFRGASAGIYRLDGRGDVRVPIVDGPIIEVPISSGFTRFAMHRWVGFERLLSQNWARSLHLAGVGARTGLVKKVLLSPEMNTADDMLALSRRLVEAGVSHLHISFHSSSLRPGLTPFVRSRADVDQLYDTIARYVEGLSKFCTVRPSTVAEAAGVAPAPAVLLGEPRRETVRAAAVTPPKPGAARRLLVINYHFPPDGSVGGLRWAAFTKYLVRLGWEVHVLTAAVQSGGGLREGVLVHVCSRWRTLGDLYNAVARRVRGGRAGEAEPAAASSHRGPLVNLALLVRSELSSLISFPDWSRGWMLKAAVRTRWLVRRFRPGVVLTSGPPHSAHLVGLLATAGTGIPLLLDLRDPWASPTEPSKMQVHRTMLSRIVVPFLERLAFHGAERVLVNTRQMAEVLKELQPGLPVTFLRSGVDFEQLPQQRASSLPALSVSYAGTLYWKRDAEPILAALSLFLERHPEAATTSRFRIAGHTDPDHGAKFAASVRAHGLESHVEVLGVLPRSAALELVSRSHIAVILAQDQGLQVPAKLYEPLAMGVRTLVIAEGESATAVEGRRLGAFVKEPADVEGICGLFEGVWSGALPQNLEATEAIDYRHLVKTLDVLLMDAQTRGG